MKRLAFAIGLLALGFSATIPARADFGVVRFNSGYCRVWTDTAAGPQDGQYLWFRHHWGWYHHRYYSVWYHHRHHWGWYHHRYYSSWYHHRRHWGWYHLRYRFYTWAGADRALQRAVWWHRCFH
jgi:hypothetical protein